ncbi:MAG TPA: hypothetical protein VKV26_20600 [Dehalococcoidia bacterium]|nr:hypothetical protein [Dehalococcoidia bacterium]
MSGARRSAQTPAWRTGLAAALRRAARVIAPGGSAGIPPVTPAPRDAAGEVDARDQSTEEARPADSAVVDPLERARAALRDARQHMSALIESDAPPPAARAELTPSIPDESAELRGLIRELRAERLRLTQEVAELRGLLLDLGADVRRLSESLTAARLPGAAGPRPLLPPAIPSISARESVWSEPSPALPAGAGEASPPAPAAAPQAGDRQPAAQALESNSASAPLPFAGRLIGRDFGWRARPEAAIAAGGACEEETAGPAERPAPAASEAGAPPVQEAAAAVPAASAEIRLSAVSTRLVVGPVRSIGRLTALERRLTRDPVLGQATLADYRRQTATFVVTPREPIALTALEPALCGAEAVRIEAAWQPDGALRLSLLTAQEHGA